MILPVLVILAAVCVPIALGHGRIYHNGFTWKDRKGIDGTKCRVNDSKNVFVDVLINAITYDQLRTIPYSNRIAEQFLMSNADGAGPCYEATLEVIGDPSSAPVKLTGMSGSGNPCPGVLGVDLTISGKMVDFLIEIPPNHPCVGSFCMLSFRNPTGFVACAILSISCPPGAPQGCGSGSTRGKVYSQIVQRLQSPQMRNRGDIDEDKISRHVTGLPYFKCAKIVYHYVDDDNKWRQHVAQGLGSGIAS